MKFSYDTAKTPNVYFSIVWQTENNFRCSIVPALNISIDGLSFKTAGPKVNDLDSRLIHLLQQYVLRFEVSMNYMVLVEKVNAI